MTDGTLHAVLNDGRSIPCSTCNCGSCNNEFFIAALSREWMPKFCPYCGIHFVSHDVDGQPSDYEPWQRGPDVRWYDADQICRAIWDGGIWWHDNGEQIYPVNIAWSPTSESFFATLGQWGWTRAQEVKDMGGKWAPCVSPEPDKAYRDAI